jgi:hypothetical protein
VWQQVAPQPDLDGIRISWTWLFGILSVLLTTIMVAGFRLVWRGAMADMEDRIKTLEWELDLLKRHGR